MAWRSKSISGVILSILVCFAAGCSSAPTTRRVNSALDFLYPQGMAAAKPASQVTLHLPLRVGLAFAPNRDLRGDPITEAQKQKLLTRVADAFRQHQGLGNLQVVPSVYLSPAGSFENLDKLAAALGLDEVVLLSYDQAQFTETTRASWTYLTLVGPLLIQGEKNDTRTLIDAVVFDIGSRALLFRAAGESTVKGSSSPLNESRKRRVFAGEGFEKATDDLIANLTTSLAGFEEQAKSGTVNGPGTPVIAMYDSKGQLIPGKSGGGSGGGGALAPPELLAAVLLSIALLLRRS
jgi:rhombotail lipoprotein